MKISVADGGAQEKLRALCRFVASHPRPLCCCQMTFLDDSVTVEEAREKGHMHIADFVANAHRFQVTNSLARGMRRPGGIGAAACWGGESLAPSWRFADRTSMHRWDQSGGRERGERLQCRDRSGLRRAEKKRKVYAPSGRGRGLRKRRRTLPKLPRRRYRCGGQSPLDHQVASNPTAWVVCSAPLCAALWLSAYWCCAGASCGCSSQVQVPCRSLACRMRPSCWRTSARATASNTLRKHKAHPLEQPLRP